MDEDRIGIVLAKTSELRFKFEEEEETETLLNIKEALQSLESQLSSLQALQQQQWYEKESALAEIEYSQKKLIKDLKEYKGKDLEIIHEAIAFAGETEDNNDLLLPPYPSRPSRSTIVSENDNLHSQKSTRNGFVKNIQESDRNEGQSGSWGPFKRVKVLLEAAAKTAVTIVGIISILSLAGYEPRLRKGDNQIKLVDTVKLQKDGKRVSMTDCPPGKVPLIENGEMRCVVKERVETPFEPVFATPDVNYGCG